MSLDKEHESERTITDISKVIRTEWTQETMGVEMMVAESKADLLAR